LKGTDDHIAADALEANRELASPMAVIDTLLMPAMGEVGRLFGEGKMFLPQVVRSARVMRRAVDALAPFIASMKSASKPTGRLLLATVRGDVHDIGKNIVGVVASTAGWEVIDLGVMVEAEKIASEAERNNVDIIGLSGLITPSLDEMIAVARELQRRGMHTPLVIGGATTSPLHTAVKIAPEYDGVVVHARDASDGVRVMAGLTGPDSERFMAEVRGEQHLLRERHNASASAGRTLLSLEEARRRAHIKSEVTIPVHTGRIVFADHSISEVEPYINWAMFYAAWQVRGHEQREQLRADAEKLLERIKAEKILRLEGVAGVFPARREGDDIVVETSRGGEIRMAQLRRQSAGKGENLSMADYVSSEAQDYIGAFALTAGVGLGEFTEKLRAEGDDYNAIMAKLLTDRLTEAFVESIHEFIRRVAWGYQRDENGEPLEIAPQDAVHGKYRGVRYAFGYPATPDHSLKAEVFELLGVRQMTSMRLTDNYMISPGEALCGLIVADADARYFTLGSLGDDQIADYAQRRGRTPEEIRKLIGESL
jgi:5-methyltetrahydrofolate--homocysteine methyltransferase